MAHQLTETRDTMTGAGLLPLRFARRRRRALTGWLSALLRSIRQRQREAASRRQLLTLAPRLLRDAGLDGDEPLRKARKRFGETGSGGLVQCDDPIIKRGE